MASQHRNYRAWTNVEETKLVEALVDMVNTGAFKADNGFKPGYLRHLEQVLKQSLPNSGILGKPHIESKLKVMKKDWQVVDDMLNGSYTDGFSYDNARHCVVAKDEVWDSYLKDHKGAGKWRNKTISQYEDLCIVFGKGNAPVCRGKDIVEMVEQVDPEEQTQHLDDDSDDIMASSHIPQSNTNVQTEETSSVRNKKRKQRVGPMVDGFNDAIIHLRYSLENISKKMNKDVEREEELEKKRAMMTSKIEKMESLTLTEKFIAIMKMRGDYERVNIFWELQEVNREAFVKFVLEG